MLTQSITCSLLPYLLTYKFMQFSFQLLNKMSNIVLEFFWWNKLIKFDLSIFYQIENYHRWQYTTFISGFISHYETRNQICSFAIKKDYEIKVISQMDVLKRPIAWWLILNGLKKIVFCIKINVFSSKIHIGISIQ